MCPAASRNAALPGRIVPVYSIPVVCAPFSADKSHSFHVSTLTDARGLGFGSSGDVTASSSLTILTHKHTCERTQAETRSD